MTISGLQEFGDKLTTFAQKFPDALNQIAGNAADEWAKAADRSAPRDQGRLGPHISSVNVTSGVWEVVSPEQYSPYMEWGTKSKASVPPELASYASQFLGGGSGGGASAKQLIYEWVLRKGLDKKAQWPIFISIMKNGVRPHPFFFIHMARIQKQLFDDLNQLMEQL